MQTESAVYPLHRLNGAVVVAVSVVIVMQMPVYKVIGVIAMRHCFMAAPDSVFVPCRMPRARMAARAIRWILRRHT